MIFTNSSLPTCPLREEKSFSQRAFSIYTDIRKLQDKIEFIEQKHIMRYQQMFAALTVRSKIDEGVNSGVIWHTQGSGKTALSYYLTYVLSDYFSKQNKVAKFYFIVDRLDLLKQASEEFEARGLVVKTASSRAELMEQFRNNQAQEGNTGKPEITVVNIQRFAEDRSKVDLPAYATNLQRVFIIDEAHRGYKPEGSFLANLLDADKNAIKIALTGTPLLKEERESWRVFGNYIHTYYYDKSILDGYTLKIIREDIETQYKERLSEIYEKLETLVEKKDVKKSQIVEHDNYVKELLRYIISDLKRFRQIQGDNTLGGMVICETSEQARKLFAYFDEIQAELNKDASMKSHLRAGLILHDSDDKDTRDKIIDDFKNNMTVDILIVFNMLLQEFGMDIVTIHSTQSKYFVASRKFELPELKLLIDAVESSKFITKKKSETLIEKIHTMTSPGQVAKLKRNNYVVNRIKPDNEQIYYIIDAINDAINAGKQISFQYYDYTGLKKKVLKNKGEVYKFSPYKLLWCGDYYYVLGYSEKKSKVINFRVDRIASKPEILAKDIIPMPDDFDIENYTKEVFFMFSGEKVLVDLRCDNSLMKTMVDRFGEDVTTLAYDMTSFRVQTEVSASPTFFGWVFGFNGKVQILAPERVKEQYRQMIAKADENMQESE